ncbi:hydrophobin [Pholiota conissans]|uniref:Hydrophobin n=1 Tax=Pholiota conissans TaxID=109636 RepID=A0A9P5YY22_9AGAR|nr:hydrophobin [Pholiota conissans]
MFSKLALFTVASMAIFAAAAPSGGLENSCNTGPVQCCNSFTESDAPVISALLALVGVKAGDVTGQVGLQCSPLTVVGLGSGSSCTSQPVCCENNSFNGVVAVGCSPINLA